MKKKKTKVKKLTLSRETLQILTDLDAQKALGAQGGVGYSTPSDDCLTGC